MSIRPFRLRAVLFDFDGTLTEPGSLDFPTIKDALGCPPDRPILEYIASVDDRARRDELHGRLERFEAAAAAASAPNRGAESLIRELRARGLALGIITRNGRAAVEAALTNFAGVGSSDFDVLVTRDVPVPHKPAPDGVVYAAEKMQVDAGETMVIGDHWLDVDAGAAAGAVTVFVENRRAGDDVRALHTPAQGQHASPDFTIAELGDVLEVAELGLSLPVGKLPEGLLRAFFEEAEASRGGLIIGPGVGEDVAAAEIDEGAVVLKSDPITFTGEDIARYAVLVNANDLATSGADPRWFLATVLLPPESTGSEALHLLEEIDRHCGRAGITLAGGHTEITDAVVRPVVSGALVGWARPADLVTKDRIAPGDVVILTKRVAVEGTALLAVEMATRLTSAGFPDAKLAAARAMVERMSVVPEARIAVAAGGISGMHDVTEGGVATGLRELSAVSGCRLRADTESIPVYGLTREMAEILDFDPLGLIGSGSLLITCRPGDADTLLRALRSSGIEARVVAEVVEKLADRGGADVRTPTGRAWPVFFVDEIARLLGMRVNRSPAG